MQSMLEYIVGRLREEPFGIAIRAVDFDDKRPVEHLQILNDILASLKPDLKTDIRGAATRDKAIDEMTLFLMMHKCDCLPSEEVGLHTKETIYPIFHWVLTEYEHLRKRTYLSRFLMPVDVPMEYMSTMNQTTVNGNLGDLLEVYKQLQEDFIEVHKQYESAVASVDRPASDVSNSIAKMETDEIQLLDRLQREQAQTSSNPNFQRLLSEASEMRQAQDDEIHLQGQKREQLRSFASAKQRLKQSKHILEVIKSCEEKPIATVLDDLDSVFDSYVHRIENEILPQRRKLETTLLQAEKGTTAILDTLENVPEDVNEMATQLDSLLQQKKHELASMGGLRGDTAVLKKEANDAVSKLEAIQSDIESKTLLREMLLSANTEIRGDDASNLLALQQSVRVQAEACVASKQEIAHIEESVAQLKQTETTLKDQHFNLVEQCRKEEERVGVLGFYVMNEQLIAASKDTQNMNELTLQAIEEMRVLSDKIVRMIDENKPDLEPKVRTLKDKRQHLETLQKRFDDEKSKYDGALAESTSHHNDLMSECSRLQKEFVEKETLLCRSNDIDASTLGRLPALGNMTTDRHKGQEVKQKTAFLNLKKLLEVKANLVKRP